ncbi:MAG: alpha-ketoglutarate-dependent dioxygenase AlkB [Actinobacteria bacterium]|nr:alpha-ketoglutarate-dependent dioxygenase AlkB [Actinomycetota bacterium]MBV9936615.1 alpha-ketoglutarate-dependent dioxygenase AlkB [Actinomycetota bacterium]
MPDPAFQGSLFGGVAPSIDPAFSSLTRRALDERAWVDHAPGWLAGSDALFGTLVELADWGQYTRKMYGEDVVQPRLNAGFLDDARLQAAAPVLEQMRVVLGERYGVEFTSGGLNYYRDGRDSVAWHRDKIPAAVVDPIVAIVSVGEPRKLLLRPRGGGRSIPYHLTGGDLLVTGGTTQRTWEHTVPKVAAAGPRISITFRHR